MEQKLAVYWDFENIHASLCNTIYGPTWYRDHRDSEQENIVKIEQIMEYILGIGQVNINKAYANWGSLKKYSYSLQSFAIELLQLFPRGKFLKNGADIKMAIDVIEDMQQNPHITTIILVGGDSDYIPIAQKVKQKGRSIMGIGIKSTTSSFLINACNQFMFYESLMLKSSDIGMSDAVTYKEVDDIEDSKTLIRKAIPAILSQTGRNYAHMAALKLKLLNMDPSFDEGNYGYNSFKAFLQACSDTVEIFQSEPGGPDLVRINETQASSTLTEMPAVQQHSYEKILKDQQIRLPASGILVEAVNQAFAIFEEDKSVKSYDDFRQRLSAHLKNKKVQFEESDVTKVKQLLYKAFSFKLDFTNKSIVLNSEIKSADDLQKRVQQLILKRILDNVTPPIESNVISRMLFGDEDHKSDIDRLIKEYNSKVSGNMQSEYL